MLNKLNSAFDINKSMFIGEKQIKETFNEGEDKIKIIFEDSPETIMNKELFEKVKTEEKNRGTITDVVNHYLATKFLAELADYNLEYYMVENVGVAMKVLAHNLREEAIRKTFKCSGGDAIPLNTLIEQGSE